MFTSVYFHRCPIGYEVMLRRFVAEQLGELEVPYEVEAYLRCDDVYLWTVLPEPARTSGPGASSSAKAFRMLVEVKEFDGERRRPGDSTDLDMEALGRALAERGIVAIAHSAKGELSKYFGPSVLAAEKDAVDPRSGSSMAQTVPIEDYTPLYQRYAGAVHLNRIYVDPDQLNQAKWVLARYS